MELSISYTELSDIVKAKSGKDVTFEYVDNKSVNVATTIKDSRVHNGLFRKIVDKLLDMVDVEVKVLLRVNAVSNDQMSVQYDAGRYADKIISRVGNNIPKLNDFVTFGGDNVVIVLLNRIEQLQDVLRKVTIHDILFSKDGVEVVFSLK